MAAFRSLLELLGLWPSSPSEPDMVGCVTTYVQPVASAASANLLQATAGSTALVGSTVTITVEGC